jgi:hypothetical protein
MKTPIAQSKHDLHQCYGKKVVSTLAYNLPYRIARHKKLVYETLPNYPKGTFFVITENSKRPQL